MKRKNKILLHFSVIIAAFTLFYSCSKDEDELAPPTVLTGYNMSADADGQFLNFNATADISDTSCTIQGQWIDYNKTADIYSLVLYLICNKGYIGNYAASATYWAWDSYVSPTYLFQYGPPSTATVLITAYDSINKTISGTFSFTAVGGGGNGAPSGVTYPSTISVTNGVFTKIPIQP